MQRYNFSLKLPNVLRIFLLFNFNRHNSLWDRHLGMTAAMTQVPVPTAIK